MNPFPVLVAAAVVAVIPPLRKRVVPVAKATLSGSVGVVGAALGAGVGVLDAAINGPQPAADD
mgnify:CR=1 FL=1|jgi:hypothetical protein